MNTSPPLEESMINPSVILQFQSVETITAGKDAGTSDIRSTLSVPTEALASGSPLTMESLVKVLNELTSARETEGRLQLYRMQEEYESKLEATQVWDGCG